MVKKRGDDPSPPRASGREDPFRNAKPMTTDRIEKWRGSIKLRRPVEEALADMETLLAQLG